VTGIDKLITTFQVKLRSLSQAQMSISLLEPNWKIVRIPFFPGGMTVSKDIIR